MEEPIVMIKMLDINKTPLTDEEVVIELQNRILNYGFDLTKWAKVVRL